MENNTAMVNEYLIVIDVLRPGYEQAIKKLELLRGKREFKNSIAIIPEAAHPEMVGHADTHDVLVSLTRGKVEVRGTEFSRVKLLASELAFFESEEIARMGLIFISRQVFPKDKGPVEVKRLTDLIFGRANKRRGSELAYLENHPITIGGISVNDVISVSARYGYDDGGVCGLAIERKRDLNSVASQKLSLSQFKALILDFEGKMDTAKIDSAIAAR